MKIKTPTDIDKAYHDSEILKEQISVLKNEILEMFDNIEKDVVKMTKLQTKATKRIKAEILYSKKRLDGLYKTLGKFHKMLNLDKYEKIFKNYK
jgi:hypothetical protein